MPFTELFSICGVKCCAGYCCAGLKGYSPEFLRSYCLLRCVSITAHAVNSWSRSIKMMYIGHFKRKNYCSNFLEEQGQEVNICAVVSTVWRRD